MFNITPDVQQGGTPGAVISLPSPTAIDYDPDARVYTLKFEVGNIDLEARLGSLLARQVDAQLTLSGTYAARAAQGVRLVRCVFPFTPRLAQQRTVTATGILSLNAVNFQWRNGSQTLLLYECAVVLERGTSRDLYAS